MSFLNPIGLIGLLSLPVILALHLLRRKQRPYIVSHLPLWSFLDQQTRGPRARRIPLTLILLLDLLLGVLLSLAWSRPSLALAQPGHNPRHYVVLLDVSSSMRAQDTGTTRFEQAKAEAEALLRDASSKDAVTVVTFGGQAQIVAESRHNLIATTGQSAAPAQIDLAGLSGKLDGVQVGQTGHDLAEALALGQTALDVRAGGTPLPAEFHVITDGAFPLPDSAQIAGFAYPIHWHWVGSAASNQSAADNQAVVELNATSLGANQLQIFARVANFGSQPVTRQALVAVDGRVVQQATVNIPSGSTVPQVWQLSPGAPASSVEVSLSGSDALAEDDKAYIGLQPGGKIRVALVAETPAPLQQAIQAIPDVDLQVIAPANYASTLTGQPAPFDLTIFRQFLPQQWPEGQVLVVDPPTQGAAGAGVQLTAGPARQIPAGSLTQAADGNPLVAGIDFSGVRWARARTLASTPGGFTALVQAGGVPVLLQAQAGKGNGAHGAISVLLADLTQGNFARHPAFPILMANLVELSRQAPIPPGFETGESLPLPAAGSYRQVRITPPRGEPVTLTQNWPQQWTDTLEPGLYRFQLTAADGSQTEFSAGARAGDLVESDLRARPWAQTIAAAQNAQAAAATVPDEQLDLRPWLLGAALLAFLVEAFLAWRR